VVDLFELEVYFVPAIGVAPRGSVVVVARNTNVAVTGGFGRRKDGEQNRKGSPIREKMAVEVMCPRVIAK
jgi:hypothetical protein